MENGNEIKTVPIYFIYLFFHIGMDFSILGDIKHTTPSIAHCTSRHPMASHPTEEVRWHWTGCILCDRGIGPEGTQRNWQWSVIKDHYHDVID